MSTTDEETLRIRINEVARFGMYEVPLHYRARLNALAKRLGVGQTEALGAALQAAEAAMDEQTGMIYSLDLRRRLCAPPGTPSKVSIVYSSLPELPELVPPLGCGMRRKDLMVFEPTMKGPAGTSAQDVLRRRLEDLEQQGTIGDDDRAELERLRVAAGLAVGLVESGTGEEDDDGGGSGAA